MKKEVKTKKVYYKELDILQKKTGNELFKLLEVEYKTRIVMGYMNLNIETTDRAYEVDIYINDYNYKIVNLKFDADISAEGYLNVIKYSLEMKYYKVHNATPEEIYLHNLIKEYGLDFCIIDGILMCENNEIADLNEVVSISKDENRIVITEERCRCVIDLESDTYYCKDIEDTNNDNNFISIDKEKLESYINKINFKTNNTHYFIKNDILYECNIKEKMQLVLTGLESIDSFKMFADSLVINLKNNNTIFLEKDFATM